MKKIIVGTLLATFLVSNSSLAFAATTNQSIDNKNPSISSKGDRVKREIPNFYYEMIEYEETSNISRDSLCDKYDEYKSNGEKRVFAANLAGLIISSVITLPIGAGAIKTTAKIATGTLKSASTSYINKNFQNTINTISSKIMRSNASYFNVTLKYRIKIKHYQYGSDPSEVESVECIGITIN